MNHNKAALAATVLIAFPTWRPSRDRPTSRIYSLDHKFIPPPPVAICDSHFMELETLYDLYLHELRDLYSAEKQLIKALPKLRKAAKGAGFIAISRR